MTTTQVRYTIDIDQNIIDLLEDFPEIAPVLHEEYGLHCVNCAIAEFDTLREGAQIHGFRDQDLEEMVEHLERIINGEEESI